MLIKIDLVKTRMRSGLLAFGILISLGCNSSVQTSPNRPAQQQLFSPALKAQVIQEIGQVLKNKAFAGSVDFSTWDVKATAARESLDHASTPEAFANALNRILKEYHLSHLKVTSESQRAFRHPGYQAYGFKTFEIPEGALVVNVVSESPADKAGLCRGDVITEMDGSPFQQKRLPPCAKATGPVHLKGVRRGSPISVDLSCGPTQKLAPPTLRWLPQNVALIRIPTFDRAACSQRAIKALFGEIENAKGLILDLRGNGGGQIANARYLATLLWRNGNHTLLYQVTRDSADKYRLASGHDGDVQTVASWSGHPYGFVEARGHSRFLGPVVVLVDQWSYSAAEMLPAALQDLKRAKVIGTRTGGEVLSVHHDGGEDPGCPLGGGFRLQYPVSVVLTPKLRVLEGKGLDPDVALDLRSTEDDQVIFTKAMEVMQLEK